LRDDLNSSLDIAYQIVRLIKQLGIGCFVFLVGVSNGKEWPHSLKARRGPKAPHCTGIMITIMAFECSKSNRLEYYWGM
jgi:hypothetical protein